LIPIKSDRSISNAIIPTKKKKIKVEKKSKKEKIRIKSKKKKNKGKKKIKVEKACNFVIFIQFIKTILQTEKKKKIL